MRAHNLTKLQGVDLDLSSTVELVHSLRDFIAGLRDQFDRFESVAQELSQTVKNSYKANTDRGRRREKASDESPEPDVGFTMTVAEKIYSGCFLCAY